MNTFVDILIDNKNIVFQGIKYPILSMNKVIINNVKHKVYKIEENSFFYFVNSKLHRENDLPAIEWEDGSKIWAVHNQIHRNTPKPTIIWAFGKVEYYWKNIPKTKNKIEKKFLKKQIEKF